MAAELYLNELQGCLIRAQAEGNIIHLMKQLAKCGNSSSAAAAGTQKRHYYGLCLRGEVAKMVSQHAEQIQPRFCALCR